MLSCLRLSRVVFSPILEGRVAILVVVCRRTKMKHCIVYHDTYDAEEVSRLYLKHANFGCPSEGQQVRVGLRFEFEVK